MPDRLRQQVLLELALALGGESDPDRLLARALPLLVRRTGSLGAGVIAVGAEGARTVHVTPRVLRDRPEWREVEAEVVRTAAESTEPSWQQPGRDAVHHVFRLPRYGVLVLSRPRALDPRFAAELAPVLDVLARPLVTAEQERRRALAEQSLANLEHRQQELLNALPYPVWLTDTEGRYLEVNTAFTAWLERDRSQIVGRLPTDVLTAELGERCIAATREVVHAEVSVREEYRDAASGRSYEHERTPYRDADGRIRGVVGFRRDITERVRSVRLLREGSDFQRLLMGLAVGFVNTPVTELDAAIDTALAQTGAFVGVDRAYVFAYDFAAQRVCNTHEWCAPGIEPQIDELQDTPMSDVQDWVDTHQRGEVIHIPDVRALPADSGVREVLEPQGIVTLMTLPIAVGPEVFGFVGFDAVRGPRHWKPEERQLLEVLAELLANAELRRRYEHELVEARRQEALVRDRFEVALQAVDDAVWDWDALTGRTFYSAAVFRLVGREDPGGTAGPDVFHGLAVDGQWARVEREVEAALGRGDERFEVELELAHRAGHRVPVRIRAVIVRNEQGAPVRLAGVVIDLTRQRAEQARQQRRLELEAVLARISARFVGLEAYDTAVNLALEDLGRVYGADRAALVRVRQDPLRLDPTHEWCRPGIPPADTPTRDLDPARLASSLAWLERGQPLLIDGDADAELVSDAQVLLQARGARSVIAIPLLVGGELVGALGLDHVTRVDAWSIDDATILRSVAELIAGALARTWAERELVRAREQAEVASEAKTRFLSTISHELRTPMGGVLGMTELLLDEPLDERQRGYVTAARDAAQGLLSMLHDLLDIARIEQDRLELVESDTDLRALINGVVAAARVAADRKDIELRASIDPAAPAHVLADAHRLRQIVTNLVSNAVRFTDVGSVTVTVRAVTDHADPADDRVRLHLEVVDTGVGIPLAAQARVFDPFVQVDPTSTRRTDGSGLGLSIVRELVTLMDGRVGLHSWPGEGTRVWVELPVVEVAASTRSSGEPRAAWRPTGLRVLLAEDNAINQAVVRGFLDGLVQRLDVVGDGAGAVAAVARETYDVVLMDCYMPGTDGLTATRRIRRGEAGSRLPIVAVTADGEASHREACLAAGMDAVLLKPFDRAALFDLLAAVVREHPPPSRDGQPEVQEPVDEVATPVLDPSRLAGLARRRTADGPLSERLLALFAEHAPGYVDDLCGAVDPPDAARFRLAAHTLKSNAATLGLERLREVCAEAETVAKRQLDTDGGASGPTPERALGEQFAHLAQRVAEEFARGCAALGEHPAGAGTRSRP